MTKRWAYRYEEIVQAATQPPASRHPVCAAVQAGVLLTGDASYPRDRVRAKPFLIESALAGLYGNQLFLSGMHIEGSVQFRPRDVALRLCWQRVADSQSPVASFGTTCEACRLGIAAGTLQKNAALPADIQRLAAEWCAPSRSVDAQECARMERDADQGARQ